ncbi:multidrug efflux SMR transporter [Streptomyces phaeolivaceus]|uniref:Multidrug efflux SMR transporter n=1 Tax=Streptomyces phaeolivaceus TaxID=2653200 RepID=A0A5P8KEQ8_9ACTN|nr:multidrug efflux SMR transporter [Streptomyces phaeolivaceus]QFR01632.1 multidrug efflux SMR transporter [Streptomyces phaeolivaceus]
MSATLGLLVAAILVEVAATTNLARTDGFRDPLWSVAVLSGYAVSLWMLSVVVRSMPVSVAYALWSGLGTAAVALVGVTVLGESWDLVKTGALLLIVVGVVVLNLHGTH